jgi:hypothetical protein
VAFDSENPQFVLRIGALRPVSTSHLPACDRIRYFGFTLPAASSCDAPARNCLFDDALTGLAPAVRSRACARRSEQTLRSTSWLIFRFAAHLRETAGNRFKIIGKRESATPTEWRWSKSDRQDATSPDAGPSRPRADSHSRSAAPRGQARVGETG